MSQENVEIAWEALSAWNEGGIDALVGYLDPEVEWHPPRESMEPGIYRGQEGVRDLGRLGEIFEERRIEPLEVIAVDDEDRVVGVARIFGKSEAFGTEIDAKWAWVITIRDGKAVRVESFTSKEEALKAAGRSE
jgi:uncharacterized protein